MKILGISIFHGAGDTALLKPGPCPSLQHGGLLFGRDRSGQATRCLSLTSIRLARPDDVFALAHRPERDCVSEALIDARTSSSAVRDVPDKSQHTDYCEGVT